MLACSSRYSRGNKLEVKPTFSAFVRVDGIDQNTLGRGMGHVAQDAKDVHVHDCGLMVDNIT